MTQRIVVYLTDTAQTGETLSSLREIAPSLNVLPAIRSKLGQPGQTIVRQGLFSFSELLQWQRTVGALKITGVVSLDADEGANRVDIGVLPEVRLSDVLDRLRRSNVPGQAVSVHHARLAEDVTGNLWGRYRPAAGGYQIEAGNGGCTLGFGVSVAYYNTNGYLTASHCGPNAGSGQVNSGIYQPNAGTESNRIGTVTVNPAWDRTDPECGYASCTYADVMYADHDPGAGTFQKLVIATFGWDLHFNDNTYGEIQFGSSAWGNFTIVPYVVQGSEVYKSGKTTGITGGYVERTCVARAFNDSHAGPHTVLCVDYFTGGSVGAGDSGGPVFYPSSGPGTQPLAIGITTAAGDSVVLSDPDPATNLRCTAKCGIYFAEWSAIQAHLNRYLTP